MPSPLKDRPSGRLGHLLAALRPARTGALPVQTGFPTSLADLVVKNHGRLKKPSSSASSKRKKRGVSPPPSPSPTLSPPPSSSPPPPAAAVSPSAHPRPDLSPVEAVRHTKGGVFGLGLGFLALGGVVSLALLVIWSKKVVAAVTVASFSLFLLESVRSSSLPRRPRPRPAATKKLDLDVRGYVSPIREVEAEAESPRPSCSDSDRGSEVSILDIEERSEAGDDSSNPKAKAKTKKRSWKKLIANKLHKGRKCKEADSSGSFRSVSNQTDAMVGGNAKATDSSDSRRGKRKQADAEADALAKSSDSSGSRHGKGNEMDAEVDNNARPIEIDASPDLTEADEGGGSRFPVVVVAVVVLVGLVAGKLPAVVFTVICSAFLSSVQRLPCDSGDVQGW